MTRLVGSSRASLRVHLGIKEDGLPLVVTTDARVEKKNNGKSLDGNRLRRLSFGGGANSVGGGAEVVSPGLGRTNGGQSAGHLASLPMEKPTFRHVDPRPQRRKVLSHKYCFQWRE